MACITTASFRATVTAFSAEVRVRPNSARSGHSLGHTFFNNGFRCALTRLKRPDEALGELRRAAELAPDRARYAYVYAVGLHSSGRGGEAMTVLQDGLVRHPGDRDTLLALIIFSRDAGEFGTALAYAERLARAMPGDQSLSALIERLGVKSTSRTRDDG